MVGMRDLALLMFMVATLPMAFTRPFIGLYLWVWFSYMNPHRELWGFAASIHWVTITALVTMFATVMHSDQRQGVGTRPIMVLMTLFLFWTGITSLSAVQPELAHANWITLLKILLLAYFTHILVTDEKRLHWLLWVVVLSFGWWAFKGGLFTILTGGQYHVFGPRHSFFHDNNHFALVMCMTLPLMRYLLLQESHKWIRYGLWLLMGLTIAAVIGTYSRGGFITLGVVLLALIWKSRRRAGLLLVMPMLAIALFMFMPDQYTSRIETITEGRSVSSVTLRIQTYKFAFNYATAHPITGGGFDVATSHAAWNEYGPSGAAQRAIHSIFFEVLADHGFVGFGLYSAMLIVAWMSLARVRKRVQGRSELKWASDLASMMQVSLVAYVVAGSALSLTYFDLIFQLYALIALLQLFVERSVKAAQRHEAENTQTSISEDVPESRPAWASRGSQSTQSSGTQNLPWW